MTDVVVVLVVCVCEVRMGGGYGSNLKIKDIHS